MISDFFNSHRYIQTYIETRRALIKADTGGVLNLFNQTQFLMELIKHTKVINPIKYMFPIYNIIEHVCVCVSVCLAV